MRLSDFKFWKPKKKNSRGYEGASKSKRLSRWKTSNTSANAETWGGLSTLRSRSRDLRRNNPYAARGIQVITSNVVGPGIQVQFRKPGSDLKVTTPLEERWWNWAHTPAIDYDGRHNLFGLQRLISDCVVESGEVLVRRRILSGLAFPVQYQVLEPDFLDTTVSIGLNGNVVIQGVEFDAQGKRVAYHLFETHPGGNGLDFKPISTKTNRIPASEVYHIFRMDRPGQARGVPWLAPCIVRIKDLDDYEDAQLTRQKIAACFVAFVRDIDPNAADSGFGAEGEDCDASEKVEPGMIEDLPANKQVEFGNPPGVEGYKDYVMVHLHAIAAGLGITYSALTGDLSQVNFSSGRMGHLEFQRNIDTWRKEIIIGQFLEFVVQDFKNYGAILGVSSEGWIHKFIPPRREMIDPTKEVPAAVEAIKAGLSSLSDELMAQGKDPAEHLAQYKGDVELIDQLDLTLTSDARNEVSPAQDLNEGGGNESQD